MENILLLCAGKALDELAKRDGVPVDEIRSLIEEAINAAQEDATPLSALLWSSMMPDGSRPSPEELIAWVVGSLGYSQEEKPTRNKNTKNTSCDH